MPIKKYRLLPEICVRILNKNLKKYLKIRLVKELGASGPDSKATQEQINDASRIGLKYLGVGVYSSGEGSMPLDAKGQVNWASVH